jgi:hypothetical protein
MGRVLMGRLKRQYITVEEVKRVCQALDISDWTKMEKPKVPLEEAEVILCEAELKRLS